MSLYEPVLQALIARGVRFVVVGGQAVVVHGHARLTIDLDIVIDLSPDQAAAAMDVLVAQGFQPMAPVNAKDFADATIRQGWIDEKHMQAFPMRDPNDIRRKVDVFVRDPIPFEDLWARSIAAQFGPTTVRVASIDDLIAMKRAAGRTQDLADIEALTIIREDTA